MVKLHEQGAYLVNGTDLIPDSAEALSAVKSKTGVDTTQAEAAKGTMAYRILKAHNTSDNMEQLKIKFDKLTSHDITFVGILQTARASGLEKFPVPYVLTNCHNSLCAVGEPSMKTIMYLVFPVQRNTVESMYHLIRQSFTSLPAKCLPAAVK